MTDTTKLVQATIKYKQKRAEIKARQRRELEDELEAWKADVGDEISEVRRHGLSVADVCNAIGNQNRTFVYDMIGASARRRGVVQPEPNPRDVVTTVKFEERPTYSLEFFDNAVKVAIDDDVSTEWYDIVVVDGVPDLPEEWADHGKDRRAMYKDIIKEINEHDWN
jgi:ATP-dependent 26S proteasome regulatory subunit